MSLAGIGSYSPGNMAQMLSSLLSRLDTTSSTTSDTSDTSNSSQSNASIGPDANLSGPTKPSLSGMILGALIHMQGDDQNGSSSTSTTSSSSSSTDPVQTLFSAMDSNSDGTVSQSELETYLAQYGGTTEQADSLYSMLNQSGSSDGISEQDMASQAPPPPPNGPPPGGRHGEHQGMDGTQSSSDIGSQLVSLFDSNSDGSVSESEFTDFVTAHGGTQTDATNEFAALDTSNSGSVTSSDFTAAIDKLQTTYANDPYAPVMSLLSAFAQTGSSVSLSA